MKNYTLKTYIKKRLNYSVLDTIEGKPFFKIGRKTHELKISDLTYEEVKGVMRELGKETTWTTIKNVFETCFRLDEGQFEKGKVKQYFEARNFILKAFTRLMKTEKALLSSIESIDSALWEQSGGASLNRFGSALALNQLGKIYGIYPFELKDKKYQEILLLLTIEKTQREVQGKYDKLKAKVKT